MDKNYFELTVRPSSHADLFSDFLLSFTDAIEENEENLILRSEEPLDEVALGVNEFAKKLSKKLSLQITAQISLQTKQNEDWIKRYQDSVKPIHVGSIYVRPSWEEPKNSLTNIIIDPALAFGSGHHESTYGCLLMLQRYINVGSRMLDVGTGSGILAIAASKLGAITDICDTDEQALKAAKENFAKNDVKYKNAWLGSIKDAKHQAGDIKYSIIVANIVSDVLLTIEKDLIDRLFNEGILVLSGILSKYSERIKSAYDSLTLIDEVIAGEWRTLVYKR
ncbi:MAG: 50S ribosomal protein L11 methyltransferase [Campylobacteraceae bacterium]|jgi:ribosomal protein L11 methyltransferase|nr:50S ribosomal protein L11 methyltransferase [Campylobacteraceae bacterium]